MNPFSGRQTRNHEAANSRLRTEIRGLFDPGAQAESQSLPGPALHFKFLKNISAGARGRVYLARDSKSHRLVAIKMLAGHASPESRQRFVREAECAYALRHPNIVGIQQVVHGTGQDFIVMEYVPGKTLDRLIPKTGMPLQSCLDYALQIAQAISAVHSAKIMHRDLKPSNFMVTKNGVVKLLDFGLAKVIDDRSPFAPRSRTCRSPKTHDGTIMGTVGYMSPEQVQGRAADQRSDIFSFGAILYELLSGDRAFQEDSPIDTMHAILHACPRDLSKSVPPEVASIVNRCLSKKPARRYQTVKTILQDLTSVISIRG